MKRALACLLFCLPLLWGVAQNQVNYWYFGNFAGMRFNGGPPVILSNSAMFAQEGCAVMSNPSGNLLFYTNGQQVYDATNTQMPNGSGLWGSSSTTQSSIIIPKPGDTCRYYIFTADGGTSGFPFGGKFAWSEVDMALNGGLGDIVTATKNTVLYDTTCEKVTAIHHANGCDVWVISHKWNSNAFYTYLVSSAGVSGPVISNVGVTHAVSTSYAGQLKGSPDGNKVAIVATWPVNVCEIFDFDRNTGILSNPVTGTNHSSPYGVEFSPNNSRLYAADIGSNNIYQYNLLAGSPAAIVASQTSIAFFSGKYAMQLAPNGKIYVARANQTTIGVINLPNVLGAGCNYVNLGQSVSPGQCRAGLPNFIQTYFDVTVANCPGTCGQVLPVELISFTGTHRDGVNVLNWQTASEIDTEFFTVERQRENGQWEEIGSLAAAGSSRSPLHYSLTDYSPPFGQNGRDYLLYRLRQTDLDGRESYAGIVQVHVPGQEPLLFLFPSPARDFVKVAGSSGAPVTLELRDLTGRVVLRETVEEGSPVAVGELSHGFYAYSLSTGGRPHHGKLLVE